MKLIIIIEGTVYATGTAELEAVSFPLFPIYDLLPVLGPEVLRPPKQVFAPPANDRAPLVRLPVPSTNRRLTQFMRMHNR
jgi:hypothetical protein